MNQANAGKPNQRKVLAPLILIDRWVDRVGAWLNIFGVTMIMAMMFLITADVTGRYGFNRPVPATAELIECLMAFIVSLGLAYTEAKHGNIGVDVVTSRLSRRTNEILGLVSSILALAFCILLTRGVLGAALTSLAIREEAYACALYIPIYPAKVVFSFGCLFLCVRIFFNVVMKISFWGVAHE